MCEKEATVTTTTEELPAGVRASLETLLAGLWPKESVSYELRAASAKGDNYIGVVYRVHVHRRPHNPYSLVLKVPPHHSARRQQFFARPLFLREIFAYEHFLPLAHAYQAERGVPQAEQFSHYARCYATGDAELQEHLILEDLCRDGYALHNRHAPLPAAHVALVMRAYAKLHAVSLALKRQQPLLLRKCQCLVEIFEQRKDELALGIYCEQLKVNALNALHPVEDVSYMRRLAAFFARGSYFDLLLPLLSGANCEPYAVVCHGDCWNNNMLYRQQSDGEGERGDVRLIDWQIMRYASPVTDLSYFFFTCTTRSFRRNHYAAMLDLYHGELSQQLQRLGESADELLPHDAFKTQLRERSAVGLLFAMMVLPIVTVSNQDVPDLQAISERVAAGGTASFLNDGNAAEFKRRMRGVILDCVDRDYI